MIVQLAAFAALVAVAHAGYVAPFGGHSNSYRKQDDFGRYNFGYDIVDGHGAANGRHETGSAYGPVVGSYYLADIDGRSRRVEYVADKLGFRAVIKTNEPGTKTSLSAAAPVISAFGKTVPSAGFSYGGGHGGGHGGGYSVSYVAGLAGKGGYGLGGGFHG
ncbi:adult-specific rigid cuticular protein 15.7-like [Ornithodoros turicata]|uniref:adult-specific rigid cuticular protein 15.7-like n=1 Tax=Ornithodoros turicata TaxID=34597 RepID=UPI0031398556